jgi:hypothetical protein
MDLGAEEVAFEKLYFFTLDDDGESSKTYQ